MHFHWSSWVHQEYQKSGSARGWLSIKSHLEEKQFKHIHDVHRVSHCRMTSTLKFSMNPPLPSEDARTPSEEERADSNGSPTMQWERVESSVCKLSRRDDRVRNCAKVAGERRDIDKCWIFIMNNQIQLLLLSFFFYLKSAELLSLVAGNLCIDEFGQKEFPEKVTLKHRTIEYTWMMSIIDLVCTIRISKWVTNWFGVVGMHIPLTTTTVLAKPHKSKWSFPTFKCKFNWFQGHWIIKKILINLKKVLHAWTVCQVSIGGADKH